MSKVLLICLLTIFAVAKFNAHTGIYNITSKIYNEMILNTDDTWLLLFGHAKDSHSIRGIDVYN